ncbi:ABC transporter permease [Saccharothrix sp. SC076]|nr:ABC transporter permease [Saccharothrix obliqua]
MLNNSPVRRNPTVAVTAAGVVLLLASLAALWPSMLAPYAPDDIDLVRALAPPGPEHWLGTDQLGRDVLSRVVHGTATTLLAGLGSIAGAVTLGSSLGIFAATAHLRVAGAIMRATDVLLAFPGLLLALLVVTAIGPGAINSAVAIGSAAAPGFVRLARSRALVVGRSGYVQAAVALGRSRGEIYLCHLVPNTLPPVLALATVNVGSAIIAGSSLGFLGLGPEPPSPEWGTMLAEGRDFLGAAPAMAVAPGVAVTLVVLSLTVVGGHLRYRFETGGRT